MHHRSKDHIFKAEEHGFRRMYCGETYQSDGFEASDPASLNVCPSCSERYWSRILKETAKGLDLAEERMGDASMRTVYRVSLGGEPIGFVGMRQGFGRAWRHYRPYVRILDDGTRHVGRSADMGNGYASHSLAVLKMIEQWQAGELPKLDELETEAREADEKKRQWKEETEARRQAARERETLIDEAIDSLLARNGLNSVERAGLEALKADRPQRLPLTKEDAA
jgi:hypothetical protein